MTSTVNTMRELVSRILSTQQHETALVELMAVRPWSTMDEGESRRNKPNGLHRLKHRVPALAPDQPALARLLVEAVLHHRRGDFIQRIARPSDDAHVLFDRALTDPGSIPSLVRAARHSDVHAWDACAMFQPEANRTRIVRTDGRASKELQPIPHEIDVLLRELLSGGISRPTPLPLDAGTLPGASREECGALTFAMWAATESELNATARVGVSACTIVEDVTGVPHHDIKKLWQRRVERPERGRRW